MGEIRVDESLCTLCSEKGRLPKLVISVEVHTAFLHCAKALMRSKLWSPEVQVDRAVLPTMGQMLRDHTGIHAQVETQKEMVERYEQSFYDEP